MKSTTWALKPHTRAKHQILAAYLNAWFPILGSWRGRINFIDGFAGPGRYDNGEPGSPVVAVNTLLNHASFTSGRLSGEINFVFVEQRDDRYAELDATVKDLAQRVPAQVKIHAVHSDFVTAANNIVGSLSGKRLAPTLALVDPFGFSGVPLNSIKRLLAFPQCEVLFNFMIESVYRFAGKGTSAEHRFEEMFGTTDYTAAPPVGEAREEFLLGLYMRQLRTECSFKHVRDFKMVNDRGRTGNHLIFGTRNDKGLNAMKQAMWKVDPVLGRRFSDQEHGLLSLFGNEPDLTVLRQQIIERFGGTVATIEEVERFVLTDTDFLPNSHLKNKTLKPLENDGFITSVDGRKKHGYPSGCSITFGQQ